MKTTATITLILSLFATIGFAQDDSSGTMKTDTGDVEVVISPKKDQDSTIVKVAGMKIIVLNDNKQDVDRVIIDDEDISADEKREEEEKKENDPVSHWAGIRIGVNGYLNDNGLPLPSGDQDLTLDYGRSLSWDLNLFEKDFKLHKQYIELVTGLGFHFANYTFDSKYTTLKQTDPFSFDVDSSRLFDRNRLKATYVTAPLMLGFSTHKDEDKAFRFAAGGEVAWRINSKLKQRYSESGDNNTIKYKGDFDLNPFLFHAVASMGYGPVNIYAKYGLNPLFQKGRTEGNLTPFDMGLQLMF